MNYYIQNKPLNGSICEGIVHEIRKGDTLYSISRRYDVSVAELIWKNPGIRVYALQPGERICVPVRVDTRPTPKPETSDTFPYAFRPGDDLDGLLSRFRMSYDELHALNPEIHAVFPEGTILMIPTSQIMRDISPDV